MNNALQIAAGLSEKKESVPTLKTLAQFERDYIEMVLRLNRGNIPQAAKTLGISPSTLYRKCSAWAEYKRD